MSDNEKIIDDGKMIVKNFIMKTNATIGTLNEIDCPICKNRGYFMTPKISIVDNVRYWDVSTKICKCMKQRNEINRIKNSGLGKYLNYRMKNFIATEQWQVDLKDKVCDFCFNHSDDDCWISFFGQNGSGKSLLASIVANNLLYNKKRIVKFINWNNFLLTFKKNISCNEDTKNSALNDFEEIKTVDVLFIDEFMQSYNASIDKKYIDELIDYRYCNNLKTIITSPVLFGELLKLNESSISRIYEKCNGQKFTIQIEYNRNKNYRLKI